MAVSTIKRPNNSNRMYYPDTYNNTRFRFFGYIDGPEEINLMIPMAFAMNSPTHPGTFTITNLKISAFGANGLINSANWDVTSYINSKVENSYQNCLYILLKGTNIVPSESRNIPIAGSAFITGSYSL